MDKSLNKAIRNGLISFCIFSFITLMFGIIELIEEGFNFINISLLLIGITLIGSIFFTPVFMITLIYFYYFRKF